MKVKMFFKKIFGAIGMGLQALLVLCVLGMIVLVALEILFVFSPLITILFVLMGTIFACAKRATAVLAIAGIAVYVASWFVAGKMGPALGSVYGTSICFIGIAMWFGALGWSLRPIMAWVVPTKAIAK